MEIAEIISMIISTITLVGVIFAVFLYFKNPQEKLEKTQLVNAERDKGKATILEQKEVENKAAVLEKQFTWYMEANNQKFADMGKRLDDAFTLAANHTNTVDTKVDKLIQIVNSLNGEVIKLQTIINERVPCKGV